MRPERKISISDLNLPEVSEESVEIIRQKQVNDYIAWRRDVGKAEEKSEEEIEAEVENFLAEDLIQEVLRRDARTMCKQFVCLERLVLELRKRSRHSVALRLISPLMWITEYTIGNLEEILLTVTAWKEEKLTKEDITQRFQALIEPMSKTYQREELKKLDKQAQASEARAEESEARAEESEVRAEEEARLRMESEVRAVESEVRAEKEARLREEQGKEIVELKRQLAAQQERQKAVGSFRAELPTMQTSVLFGTLGSGGPEAKRPKGKEPEIVSDELGQGSCRLAPQNQ